jgi:hypothetical protein
MHMPRIALVWADDSGFPRIVTDDPTLEIYSVDERHPDDRLYRMSAGVEQMSPAEFANLIAGEVHHLGDKPAIEQAVRAILNLGADGKPALAVVDDGKCAGGEVPPLDGSQCGRCGATENDTCPYEKP